MPQTDTARSNPSAVLAVRGLLGCDEETATDVVEVVRPHLERPLQLALEAALAQQG